MRFLVIVGSLLALSACNNDVFETDAGSDGGDSGDGTTADGSFVDATPIDAGENVLFDDALGVGCAPWTGGSTVDTLVSASQTNTSACQVCVTSSGGYIQRIYKPPQAMGGTFSFQTQIGSALEAGGAAQWAVQLDLDSPDGGTAYGNSNGTSTPALMATETHANASDVTTVRIVITASIGQCFLFAKPKLVSF